MIRRVLLRGRIAAFPMVMAWASVGSAAGLPLYRTVYTYTNTNIILEGFNNAGDIASRGFAPSLPNQTTALLLRGGAAFDLTTTPVGVTNQLVSLYDSDISQTNGDGSVKVLGWIDQSGRIRRGIILNVSAAGTVTSSQLLPYYVRTDTGETNVVEPIAMNSSGVVVGNSVYSQTVIWFPPYDVNPGASVSGYSHDGPTAGVDDQGRVLDNDVSFDYGGPLARLTAVVDDSVSLAEVPYFFYTNYLYAGLMTGNAIHGGYVVGHGLVPEGDSRAFVWHIGDASSMRLPDPPIVSNYYTVRASEAKSVNSNGDVVGWVYLNAAYVGLPSGNFPVLWKRSGSAYTPYWLYQLLLDENNGNTNAPLYGSIGKQSGSNIRINDAGQIAYEYNPNSGPTYIAVLNPITNGIVEVTTPYPYCLEEDSNVTVTVNLTRNLGYSNAVSVSFTTSNDTARAGFDYVSTNGTITWAAGESGSKDIHISLINDFVWEEYGTQFYLYLTSASGAELDSHNSAQIYEGEGAQNVMFVNGANAVDYSTPYGVAQGYNHVILTLERTGTGDGMMVISNLATFDSTAFAGIHYMATNKTVSWAAGELGKKIVTVNLLNGSLGGSPKLFGMSGTSYLIGPTNSTSYYGVYGYVSIEPTNQLDRPTLGTSISPVQGTNFGFDFNGVQGGVVSVEHSTNLINWNEIMVFTNTDALMHLSAPFTNTRSGHFYRTRFK